MELKKILLDLGQKAELKEICKTTYPTIRVAINGKVTTNLHAKIREEAIKLGGREKL